MVHVLAIVPHKPIVGKRKFPRWGRGSHALTLCVCILAKERSNINRGEDSLTNQLHCDRGGSDINHIRRRWEGYWVSYKLRDITEYRSVTVKPG